MGNTNEKILMEQVARSPAVQNIVHETAAKLARVLSASVIELCREILNQPVAARERRKKEEMDYAKRMKAYDARMKKWETLCYKWESEDDNSDVRIYCRIRINNQPFDGSKYERRARDVVHQARRKIIDGNISDSEKERSVSRGEKGMIQRDKWVFGSDDE